MRKRSLRKANLHLIMPDSKSTNLYGAMSHDKDMKIQLPVGVDPSDTAAAPWQRLCSDASTVSAEAVAPVQTL